MKLIDYAGILSVVLLCSCGKESIEEMVPASKFPDPSNRDNIELYNEKTYTQARFCEFIGNSCSDYVNAYFTEEVNNIFQLVAAAAFEKDRSAVDSQVAEEKGLNRFISFMARDMWSVKKIDYAYWTISYSGEPIRLSATLVVPVLNSANVAHTLSGISLCSPHEANGDDACPTRQGTLLMARVAFNHAVVVPDYEGRGLTSSLNFSSIFPKVQARQAIDAELAALTILEDQGYLFADGFGTYNIGISAGCGVSYHVHYMVENVLTQEQSDRINLKMSFAADGIVDNTAYVNDLLSIDDFSEIEAFQGIMMRFVPFFSCLPESERGGYEATDLLSGDILNEYHRVDMTHPLIKILKTAMASHDLNFNWEPNHPIIFEASYDDSGINPKNQAQAVAQMLGKRSNGLPNTNVHLQMFETPVTVLAAEYIGVESSALFTHMMADVISFLRAMENLEPFDSSIEQDIN